MSSSVSDTAIPTPPTEEASSDVEYRSPLWMVTPHKLLNEFLSQLERYRAQILARPEGPHEIVFSKTNIAEVRASFAEMIRAGEERLHLLCELLCHSYFGSVHIQSVVIGEVLTTHERFTLTQAISREDLYSSTDLDLGNRQIQKLRFFDGSTWSPATLVANMVEYQAGENNVHGIHKLVSRIKAEEEIWNKVVDELFDLDSLVRRDKKISHLSRFVKDVFGLKIVTGSIPELERVQQSLKEISWDEATLSKFGIPAMPETGSLEFLEVKDYIGNAERKRSGWEAMKSVVRWWDKIIEIQIQPLGKLLREREFLTKESHIGFKSKREDIRNKVAEQIPLFGFFRDLLRWLFSASHEAPPTFPGVKVVVK